jgi:transglutaminase-like putative cysteine protease
LRKRRIYVPGSGWIAYDPTNGTIGGQDLIRIAVTRDISQAVPISGSFVGTPGSYLGMKVNVTMASDVTVASNSGVSRERRLA